VTERAAVAGADGARALVSIDGIDGSGKSRFTNALAAACDAAGVPSFVFHVDDFRRPLGSLAHGAVGAAVDGAIDAAVDEASVYYDRYYDFALLDGCLRAFLDGAPGATIPRFDAKTETLTGTQALTFADAQIGFLEGVFVLRAPTAAAASVIVLEVTEEEARRRILARDMARGRPRDVVEHRMNHRYFPAQRAYRAAFDPLRRADVVVDNERWATPRVVRLAPGRLPRLVEKVLPGVIPS
jgi:uridine kinase